MSMNEATAADLTEGKSEVVCEAGKLINSATLKATTAQLTNWLDEIIQPQKQ